MYTIKHITLDYAKVRKATFILEALQNQRRQKIIDLLDMNGALESDRIAYELKMNMDTVNQHLAALRRTGVVKIERANRRVFYHLDDTRLEKIVNSVHRFVENSERVPIEKVVEEI